MFLKYLRLPKEEKKLLYSSIQIGLKLRYKLRSLPFPKFKKWFTEEGSKASTREQHSLRQIVRATLRSGRLLAPKKKPCLHQALSAYLLCLKNKIKTSVIIGVRQKDQVFEAHAWLVHEDQVVIGNLPDLNEYQEITRFENL